MILACPKCGGRHMVLTKPNGDKVVACKGVKIPVVNGEVKT